MNKLIRTQLREIESLGTVSFSLVTVFDLCYLPCTIEALIAKSNETESESGGAEQSTASLQSPLSDSDLLEAKQPGES